MFARTVTRFALVLFVILLFDSPLSEAASEQKQRPNVVIFITDDESWLERSQYGWANLPTPAFDRVAEQGVLFTHGYTSAPSCAPSRASLLTGRNFWELEQGAFIQAWLPKKFPVLPDLLEQGDYAVGRTGKGWGPGVYPDQAHDSDSAGPACNRIRFQKRRPGMNSLNYAANFEAFLQDVDEDQPFYFWVGVSEPHGPWDKENYQRLEEETGLSFEEMPVPGFLPDTPGIRKHLANIRYEILKADQQLERILNILQDSGQLENTLLIVTSDNGTAIPRSKATPYDWGVHEPFAIMWPEKVPAGRTIKDFVNFPDLAPTILEAAHLPIPEGMSGRSLLPILCSDREGREDPTRDFVVTGLEWHGEFPPDNRASRTIRTERFAYIRNYGQLPVPEIQPENAWPDSRFSESAEEASVETLLQRHFRHPGIAPFVDLLAGKTPEEELYDLRQDPWQTRNLIDDPEYADIVKKLKKQMRDYQAKTGDPRVIGKMDQFEQTRDFVQERKRNGYPR